MSQNSFNYLLLVFLISIGCKTFSIPDQLANYDIKGNIKEAKVDQLGNIYLLKEYNNIVKYNPDLIFQYEYADNTLGEVTTIDVSDPLKILIYKKDYGLLIILDNTLAELNRINLYELDYQSVSAVGTALDRNIWIYDDINYQLLKINDQGRTLINSISLVDQGLQNIQPSHIQEKSGKLILQDYQNGIFLFDNLGQYIQTFPFSTYKPLQFDGQNIIYFNKNKIVVYDTKFFNEKTIALEPKEESTELKNAILKNNKIYYIYNDGLNIYPL
jgi:hypothetical protein